MSLIARARCGGPTPHEPQERCANRQTCLLTLLPYLTLIITSLLNCTFLKGRHHNHIWLPVRIAKALRPFWNTTNDAADRETKGNEELALRCFGEGFLAFREMSNELEQGGTPSPPIAIFAIIPLKASTALAVTLPRNWTGVKDHRWLHCTRRGKVGLRAAATHGKSSRRDSLCTR